MLSGLDELTVLVMPILSTLLTHSVAQPLCDELLDLNELNLHNFTMGSNSDQQFSAFVDDLHELHELTLLVMSKLHTFSTDSSQLQE